MLDYVDRQGIASGDEQFLIYAVLHEVQPVQFVLCEKLPCLTVTEALPTIPSGNAMKVLNGHDHFFDPLVRIALVR